MTSTCCLHAKRDKIKDVCTPTLLPKNLQRYRCYIKAHTHIVQHVGGKLYPNAIDTCATITAQKSTQVNYDMYADQKKNRNNKCAEKNWQCQIHI